MAVVILVNRRTTGGQSLQEVLSCM